MASKKTRVVSYLLSKYLPLLSGVAGSSFQTSNMSKGLELYWERQREAASADVATPQMGSATITHLTNAACFDNAIPVNSRLPPNILQVRPPSFMMPAFAVWFNDANICHTVHFANPSVHATLRLTSKHRDWRKIFFPPLHTLSFTQLPDYVHVIAFCTCDTNYVTRAS